MQNGTYEREPVENSRSGSETLQVLKLNLCSGAIVHKLGTIVLSVDPSLLYILGEPKDPVEVWTALSELFDRKTCAIIKS